MCRPEHEPGQECDPFSGGDERLCQGIEASDHDVVFVSPPTEGWVLAVGFELADHPPDVVALSAQLGTEVQFFATLWGGSCQIRVRSHRRTVPTPTTPLLAYGVFTRLRPPVARQDQAGTELSRRRSQVGVPFSQSLLS